MTKFIFSCNLYQKVTFSSLCVKEILPFFNIWATNNQKEYFKFIDDINKIYLLHGFDCLMLFIELINQLYDLVTILI